MIIVRLIIYYALQLSYNTLEVYLFQQLCEIKDELIFDKLDKWSVKSIPNIKSCWNPHKFVPNHDIVCSIPVHPSQPYDRITICTSLVILKVAGMDAMVFLM